MNEIVLVVDDDTMIRMLLRRMLEPAGYHIIEAIDGFDALIKIKHHQPDAMILNILMPRIDGITVCEMVRKEKTTSTIPIILLTGQAQLSAVNEGLRAGATHYLTKPMSRKTLLNTLHKVFGDE